MTTEDTLSQAGHHPLCLPAHRHRMAARDATRNRGISSNPRRLRPKRARWAYLRRRGRNTARPVAGICWAIRPTGRSTMSLRPAWRICASRKETWGPTRYVDSWRRAQSVDHAQLSRFYYWALNSSIVIRWAMYILPILAILWIPGIVGLTAVKTATVWGVKLVSTIPSLRYQADIPSFGGRSGSRSSGAACGQPKPFSSLYRPSGEIRSAASFLRPRSTRTSSLISDGRSSPMLRDDRY